MSRQRHPLNWLIATLAAACAFSSLQALAQTPKADDPSQAPKMTPQTRIQVIKSLQSERVFARVLFPQGEKGLKLKNGVISPSQQVIAQEIAEFGPAVKPGDRCVITDVQIKEKEILIDVNGGNKKKGKWYQHIQISGSGGASAPLPGTPAPQSLDAKGSSITLEFDKYVPDVTGDQIREMLAPVFDFHALSAAEAYQKTLPPKLKAAIQDHKILVGMDKDMVMYAKGRPQQRIRDKDEHGQDYEEWIYGKPPEEVDFVRFKGNEVARLEIMTVDGKKEIRTEREIDLPKPTEAEVAEQKPAQKPQGAPTLRRPGEQPEPGYPSTTADHRAPLPQDPDNPNNPNSRTPDANGNPQTQPTVKVPTGTPPINPNPTPQYVSPGA